MAPRTAAGRIALGDIRGQVRAVLLLAVALALGLAALQGLSPPVRPWPLVGLLLVMVGAWVWTERLLGGWLGRLNAPEADRLGSPPTACRDQVTPEGQPAAAMLASMAATIARQEAALADTAAEKDALVREIHHRVRNNLQVLASLVNMQRRTTADAAADAALSDMRDRIAAMALIHRTLYQGADLRHVDAGAFLDELIKDQVLDQLGPEPRVHATLEAPPLLLGSDRLATFALFAVEAISNVRKHAVSGGEGTFLVRLSAHAGEAELLITDQGCGTPPDLSHQGRGRTLMAGFARQLRGRLEVLANDDGGVSVRLTFPIGAEGPHPGPAGDC